MATTRKPTAADVHCLPLLNHLARVGTRAADAALAPGALRPRHLVVLMLLDDHGPAGQQSLAAALSLDPTNVVGLLNELEQRGLVARRRDPADRRRHIVEIADAGRTELHDAQCRLARVEDNLLRALSPQERTTLHHLLLRASAGHHPDSFKSSRQPAPFDDSRPDPGEDADATSC